MKISVLGTYENNPRRHPFFEISGSVHFLCQKCSGGTREEQEGATVPHRKHPTPPPPPSEEILGSCESKCGKEPILTHFSPLSKALAPLSEDFYFLVPPLVLSPLLSTPPLKHSDDSVGQNGHNLKSLSGNELVWRQPFAVTPNK